MAAARERAARIMPAEIELPVLETPQYVDENGYEVDARTFALALQKAAEGLSLPLQEEHYQSYIQAEPIEKGMDASGVEEATGIEAAMPEVDVENAEPLLSLSERYAWSFRSSA